jgi:hypothetical protein
VGKKNLRERRTRKKNKNKKLMKQSGNKNKIPEREEQQQQLMQLATKIPYQKSLTTRSSSNYEKTVST